MKAGIMPVSVSAGAEDRRVEGKIVRLRPGRGSLEGVLRCGGKRMV
jgi:hypothetical protein